MNIYNYSGFIIQKEFASSKEAMALMYSSAYHKIPIKIKSNYKEVTEDWIPSGSVEWVEKILGKHLTPDYYPQFMSGYLNRKVWTTDKWPLGELVFIKPADNYKRFTGFITNRGYHGKKRAPYICSEVIKFDNEWRYYISNGRVLTGEWYSGDDITTPEAPELNVEFPEGYCGAVDMGLYNGKLTLVEAQHPFSCGWYGKNHDLYTQWLIEGWNYINVSKKE